MHCTLINYPITLTFLEGLKKHDFVSVVGALKRLWRLLNVSGRLVYMHSIEVTDDANPLFLGRLCACSFQQRSAVEFFPKEAAEGVREGGQRYILHAEDEGQRQRSMTAP